MEAPAVTRYRRPFLAPVWLTMLAVVFALIVAFVIYRSATTTVVVLVRPVEKEAGTIDDPPLSPDGEQRAERLAEMLGEKTGVGRIDAIYVSDARHAQQVITPLADRLGKRPVVIPSGDVGAMASRLTRGHDRESVLFVGDGSNVPQLVQELSGIEVGPVTEKEHDTLNEGADQVRDLTARGDVLVAIDVRREARYDKRADDTATGVNRHRQARPATGGDGDRTFHRVANDARIALRVIDDEDATREDRREVPVVDGIPTGWIEVSRVAPRPHCWSGATMLREHSERAAVILEVGDDHSIVRYEALGSGREFNVQ